MYVPKRLPKDKTYEGSRRVPLGVSVGMYSRDVHTREHYVGFLGGC